MACTGASERRGIHDQGVTAVLGHDVRKLGGDARSVARQEEPQDKAGEADKCRPEVYRLSDLPLQCSDETVDEVLKIFLPTGRRQRIALGG